MSFRKIAFLLSVVASISSIAPQANAMNRRFDNPFRPQARLSMHMREGSFAMAPFAFIRYCVANPADCRGSEQRIIAWTPENRDFVAMVNHAVNRSIAPRNDVGEDVWQANVTAGDCEDYVLTKRRALIRAGFPASALRIAVATTASGEGHAVLVAKTSAGDFVLDNRVNMMRSWYNTDLRFLKITSAEDPKLWHYLG